MKKWAMNFWKEHGGRLIFMSIATAFGAVFYFTTDMQGEAKAILVGVAMLAYNKARSNGVAPSEPEPPK